VIDDPSIATGAPEVTKAPALAEAPNASPPKPRRKRQGVLENPATGPGEEWMLTYMDTVTLLVTLFVMILSFANFDKKKFDEFKQGMSLAKYGAGILMGTIGIQDKAVAEKVTIPLPTAPSSPPASVGRPSPETGPQDLGEEALLATLRDQIGEQGLANDVQLRKRAGTVEMEINESVLFPLGSAELSPTGLSILTRLSGLLRAHEGTIAVEGHTDNLPIETAQFPSNWELSGGRASSVARHLISGGMDSRKVRIVGYADTRPLAGNNQPEGRQRNRRVNIRLELTASPAAN